MNCLVTGVSRGIGRATIAEPMRQGHSVWGVSRIAVPDLREEEQGRLRHSFCDVGDSESRRRAAEEMDAAGFWPDAVILNAAFEYEEEKTALCLKRPPRSGRGKAGSGCPIHRKHGSYQKALCLLLSFDNRAGVSIRRLDAGFSF